MTGFFYVTMIVTGTLSQGNLAAARP